MDYRPTRFDDSVNVTAGSPLVEFLKHVIGMLVLMVAVYLLLGLLIDMTVSRISVKQEQWLFERLNMDKLAPKPAKANAALQQKLQTLLDAMPEQSKPEGYHFRLLLDDSETVNAYAMPGGAIVVTRGLLDALSSENALVFVLGHELGHFAERDHLRGMGRGLVSVALGVFLFGEQSEAAKFIGNMVLALDYNHSREQERHADAHGLQALTLHYGHAGGATEFFHKLRELHAHKEWINYGSTHPLSSERIATIEKAIRETGTEVKPVSPASWR